MEIILPGAGLASGKNETTAKMLFLAAIRTGNFGRSAAFRNKVPGVSNAPGV
jgi:hypothetical protein